MKKTLLTFGALGTAVSPAAIVISCGSNSGGGFNYSGLNEKASYQDVESPIGNDPNIAQEIEDLKNLNLQGQGSSSVLPVIDSVKKEVSTMQYEGTGSGDGLKVGLAFGGNTGASVITGKDFGMTSSTKVPASGQTWTDVRTVTWALDAIGIGLHLPSGVSIEDNKRPIINIEELAKIYDNEAATTTTWAQLLENESADSDKDKLTSTPKALGRTGGKSASGTADGFWHTLKNHMPNGSTPDLNHEHLTQNGGETTAEANSVALNALKEKEGSVTYLSLGYAIQNQDSRMVVATIDAGSGSTWIPSIENAQDGSYNWRRPFNIIYKVGNTPGNGLPLIKFLLSTAGQKMVAKNAFVPLTSDQFNTQFGSTDRAAVFTDLAKSDITKGFTVGGTNVPGLKI